MASNDAGFRPFQATAQQFQMATPSCPKRRFLTTPWTLHLCDNRGFQLQISRASASAARRMSRKISPSLALALASTVSTASGPAALMIT